MDYRPSDAEFKKFEEFARELPGHSQMTARKLLDAGVVGTRSEASRVMRYLDENGVLSSRSKNSGFILENLGALQYVRKGVSLVYPSNPNEPVIFIGKNTDGAKLPETTSFKLCESGIEIAPYKVDEAGGRKVVIATAEIRPPFLLAPRYERVFQHFMLKYGIPVRIHLMDKVAVGRPFELSAANAATNASKPVALLHYLHTHNGTLLELGNAAATIMDYERRGLTRREAPRPDMSFRILDETFDEEIKPFVEQKSPGIKNEMQKMVTDLWRPRVISNDSQQEPAQVLAVGTEKPKKRNRFWLFFSRSSD